jgi:hypothetical protein
MKFYKNENEQFVISSYTKYFDFNIKVDKGYSFLWITYVIINSIILYIGLYISNWARYGLNDIDTIEHVEKYKKMQEDN